MNHLARIYFLLAIICGSHIYTYAQMDIPINTWRTHFNFRSAQALAVAGQKIYCASNTGLFYFDMEDNSLNKLSKIDGFSSNEITSLGFDGDSETLVITYSNGGIDLLKDNKITTINTIRDAALPGSKKINNITFIGEIAYLASDFGLVVVDLSKIEIKETYDQLGPMGTSLVIFGATQWQDSLFLATDQGTMAGSLDPQINLQDFTNWLRFDLSSDGLPQTSYINIVALDNSLITGNTSNQLFQYKEGQWQLLPVEPESPIVAIDGSQGQAIITLLERLIIIGSDGEETTIHEPLIDQPQQALFDQSMTLWVADKTNGLVTDFEGGFQNTFPSGPFTDYFWSFETGPNSSLIATSGGYNSNSQPLKRLSGFYQFIEGEWNSYNSSAQSGTKITPEIQDLVDVSYNSVDQKYYFASFGDGLIQWNGSEFVIIDENTPGSPLINTNPPERHTRVSSTAIDAEGAVWITNYGNIESVHRFQPSDNIWQSYSFGLAVGQYPLDIIITTNAHVWLRIDSKQGGGIIVFDQNNSQQKYLTSQSGSGGLPSRNVNVIVEDLDQTVWVGTDRGLAIFPFAFDLLNQDQIDALIPKIEGRPLLNDEAITSIAVDGGNRKWVGTQDGVWLFTPDGDEVVHNFTTENSPLPSNQIISIHIQPESGEVFFGTDKGMVSFRADATAAEQEHQNVKIFPNPVTKEFVGDVGISGLANNSIIKITDVSGKLVRETRAQGGTATWNVADYQGRRVVTGVYLIFSASANGDQSFVGKIAVIN